jgi:hypothetical protein
MAGYEARLIRLFLIAFGICAEKLQICRLPDLSLTAPMHFAQSGWSGNHPKG